jgi:hypothetical protein
MARGLMRDAVDADMSSLPPSVASSLTLLIKTTPSLAQDAAEMLRALESTQAAGGCVASSIPVMSESRASPGLDESMLSEALLDLGYSSCSSVQGVKTLLSHCAPLTEASIASALGMMANTRSGLPDSGLSPLLLLSSSSSSPSAADVDAATTSPSPASEPTTWDVAVFVEAVTIVEPALSWPRVINCLDSPSFAACDLDGIDLIVRAYRMACADPFPIQA